MKTIGIDFDKHCTEIEKLPRGSTTFFRCMVQTEGDTALSSAQIVEGMRMLTDGLEAIQLMAIEAGVNLKLIINFPAEIAST